jgi:beta-lactam-binding protein with PASTA domain
MGNLWLFLKSKTFAVNAVLALLFFIVLGVSAQSILKWVTGFGEVQTVPDLSGMSLEDAQTALSELELEGVLLDSALYRRELRPREVYQQYPVAGSVVKAGRQVMLTINRSRPELVRLPAIKERTLARAELDLRSRGLYVSDIQYVPDVTDGLVLEVEYNGRPLEAGSRVRKGAGLTLRVGMRSGDLTQSVPDLTGLSYGEAKALLQLSGLGIQWMEGDTTSAAIQSQSPVNSNGAPALPAQAKVRVWLK